ncbi:MAG: DUF2384 domain-containing protein [Gammaproteobacteria bacterium]|nr:MAG: DUF2384 domain-containing protein [Gammaproteobacteria bacterium]
MRIPFILQRCQLALLLIRLYRGLYALLGGDEAAMKHWMRSSITTLRGTPATLIHDVTGLVHVVEYIDAIRGKV